MAERTQRGQWPLFGLRVRTPRLELRPPTDEDLDELADLAAAGVHDPGAMPFEVAWTDLPEAAMRHGLLQYHWRQRGELTAERWTIPFVTVEAGHIVGTQDLAAEDFAVVRSVKTGSWVGRGHQGRGIGKEMRAAVLHLAFAGLGALEAHSAAYLDNHGSIGVSRALGYADNGVRRKRRRDRASLQLQFRMSREAWEERRRDDIEIEGLEPCLDLLGLEHQTPVQEPSSSTKDEVSPRHS